jgi:hypothetical protein
VDLKNKYNGFWQEKNNICLPVKCAVNSPVVLIRKEFMFLEGAVTPGVRSHPRQYVIDPTDMKPSNVLTDTSSNFPPRTNN